MQKEYYENWIAPFVNKMYRLSKRLLISHEEAEDATQEIILKLCKTNNQYIENKESFLLKTTKNYCLDILRSKRSQNLRINENDDFTSLQNLSKEIESKDKYSIVSKIIEKLPTQQKMIMQLREIEEMEYEEIGKIMEMEPTAVRMQMSRARKTIKETFEKIENYGT